MTDSSSAVSNELIRLQGEVEALKQERGMIRGHLVTTLEQRDEATANYTRSDEEAYQLQQQLTDALRINSALWDAVQRSLNKLDFDEVDEAYQMLLEALTQSTKVSDAD